MKGFIQRFALVIHWIGFAAFVLGVLYVVFGLMVLPVQGLLVAQQPLGGGAGFIGFGLFLWVLKWLISGNKSLFPWKS